MKTERVQNANVNIIHNLYINYTHTTCAKKNGWTTQRSTYMDFESVVMKCEQ